MKENSKLSSSNQNVKLKNSPSNVNSSEEKSQKNNSKCAFDSLIILLSFVFSSAGT